ncbi:ABC transporter ATP-binding protein [Pontibacillus litoralis]|uniref:Bacitracin ABC transporter ATP-binding protein n=1 Tax=Pontibacillus litoralis JSM 072002 TaxID=1385512 RepID=A0A0A5FZD6_9BACI|nr:ABC transporter ATP-binding protein [Pontibacillus litoralis]KGX84203.1 bacitracin ABC transporter ATP-binding protein [Pontibacillus litoralis JSM 072002]
MLQAIQTNRLSKSYKDFQAVKDVSLSINKGEIYGFIGLNGAGKTTTIRMLLGMIRPTYGTCYINGEKVNHKNRSIWGKVGYMVETPYSYPELSVEENLEIYRRLRLISNPQVISQVMNQLNIAQFSQKKVKDLSLGNAQRLGIAKAILHLPEILILDEPVNGLDPAGIVEIRELLRDLAFNKGVTILISSHLLSEVAKIATKIGIIHEGQLIQEIESNELNKLLNQRLIIDSVDNKSAVSKLSIAGYTSLLNKNGLIETYNKKAIQHPEEISRFLVYKGFPPTKLVVEEEDLESYFLRIIRGKGEVVQ